MKATRRISIATFFGFLMGLICWLVGVYLLGNEYTTLQVVNIFAHRTIMGFVIGISVLRMNWALHGVILGSLIGSLFILYEAILGYPMWIWAGLLIPGNAAYGFFSELFTTKVFNAPVNK